MAKDTFFGPLSKAKAQKLAAKAQKLLGVYITLLEQMELEEEGPSHQEKRCVYELGNQIGDMLEESAKAVYLNNIDQVPEPPTPAQLLREAMG